MKLFNVLTRNYCCGESGRGLKRLVHGQARPAAALEPSKKRQNELFDRESERQLQSTARIEKITVTYNGKPTKGKLLMNKNLSTPYHVALHISEWLAKNSALARVNGDKYWDLHSPLEEDCELELLTLTEGDPFQANRAFWRTCSFLLGAVINNAFNSSVNVTLHSFPSPNLGSGSFIYDAALSLKDWKPSPEELRALSADLVKLSYDELDIQRLDVSQQLAQDILADNRFKLKQIPDIAAASVSGKVTLYRVGSHIDISKGPMVANTGLIGRASVTAVHQVDSEDGPMYRFQGVALPRGILLNHFAYRILEERSAKLNTWSGQVQHPSAA